MTRGAISRRANSCCCMSPRRPIFDLADTARGARLKSLGLAPPRVARTTDRLLGRGTVACRPLTQVPNLPWLDCVRLFHRQTVGG
jgi:hypothetical protein